MSKWRATTPVFWPGNMKLGTSKFPLELGLLIGAILVRETAACATGAIPRCQMQHTNAGQWLMDELSQRGVLRKKAVATRTPAAAWIPCTSCRDHSGWRLRTIQSSFFPDRLTLIPDVFPEKLPNSSGTTRKAGMPNGMMMQAMSTVSVPDTIASHTWDRWGVGQWDGTDPISHAHSSTRGSCLDPCLACQREKWHPCFLLVR